MRRPITASGRIVPITDPLSVTASSPAPSRSISITVRTVQSAPTLWPAGEGPASITSRAVSTPSGFMWATKSAT